MTPALPASSTSSALASLVLSIFILILLGYLAKAFNLLESKDAGLLNKVIIYLSLPAMVFQAVRGADFSARLIIVPAVAIAISFVSLGVAYLIGRAASLKKTVFGGFLLTASVGNTGYLGYPMTRLIFGQDQLVKAIFYDIFGTIVFVFTVGLYISESYGAGRPKINKIKEFVSFPPLIALVIGYLFKPIYLPGFFSSAISFLAAATIPLIMISIGLSLQMGKFKDFIFPLAALVVVKLIIGPLLAVGFGVGRAFDPATFKIIILEASMPTAMFTLIFGLKFKLDTDFLSAAILLTTAASLVTIPVWQQIAAFVLGAG